MTDYHSKLHTLNIGLKIGKTNEDIPYDTALSAVKNRFQVIDHAFIPKRNDDPHDEDTIYVKFRAPENMTHPNIHELSDQLGQEAIAYKNEDTGIGYLAGPKAVEWGPFAEKHYKYHK